VFATMRRNRRSATMKDELGQSVDHLRRAAALAAQETTASVGPRFYAARDRVQPVAGKAKDAASNSWGSAVATLTPLVTAASDNLRQASKVSRKQAEENAKTAKKFEKNAKKLEKKAAKKKSGGKGSRLLGYALVGTAVGVGAATMMRKRKAEQWDEYDPSTPVSSTQPAGGADDAAFEPAEPTAYADPDIVVERTAVIETTAPGATRADATATNLGTDDATASDLATDDATASDLATDDVPVVGTGDQTSSAQHSPKVARMAGGKNKD
jgi:hypothetical protein